MTDGAFSWLAVPLAQVLTEGEPIPRGMHRLTGRYACYGVYPCADGRFMSVGALEPKFWRTLCEALDRPDLVDGQYAEGAPQEHLRAELASVFASRPRDEWTERLAGLEVCCEPVLELAEADGHPQIQARGLVHQFETGAEIAPQVPFQPDWRRLGPPRLGQHTFQVLGEVGVGEERLEELRASGVV
jgi:crotonobetainyl-CoA:carnitine CoA-transferase CaiB-like acyl-CoA transferase